LACNCKEEEDCPDPGCWVQDIREELLNSYHELDVFVMQIETHLESVEKTVTDDGPLSRSEEMALRGTVCLVLEKIKNRPRRV